MAESPHSHEDTPRETLVKLGAARVKHLISQGALVQHLIVPAYEWLDELDKKEGDHAVAQRQE